MKYIKWIVEKLKSVKFKKSNTSYLKKSVKLITYIWILFYYIFSLILMYFNTYSILYSVFITNTTTTIIAKVWNALKCVVHTHIIMYENKFISKF